jgi:hypothetical protein
VLVFGAALFFFLSGAYGFAATIYLKNGEVVNGEVVEKQESYIKVMVKSGARIFIPSEIERIEYEAPPLEEVKPPEGSVSEGIPESGKEYPKGELYTNKEFGFSFCWPVGWIAMPAAPRNGEVYLEKNSNKSSHQGVIPGIRVLVTPTSIRVLDTPLESRDGGVKEEVLINNTFGFLEKASQGAESAFLEKPHAVTIGNLRGVKAVKKYAAMPPMTPGNPKNVNLVSYTFILKGEKEMISFLLYAHGDERFAEELNEMESVVKSFTFISEAE